MISLRRLLPALLLVGLLGGLWSPGLSAAEPEPSFVPDQVVVQYNEGTDAAQHGRARGRAQAQATQTLHRQANGLARLEVVTLPRGASVQGAVAALHADPAVAFAEPNWIYTHGPVAATALPGDRGFNNNDLWGMYGNTAVPGCDPGKTCTNPYGSRAADAWAKGATGSAAVYVGVIDEGLRWDHPDLNGNVWTNPGEIPDNGIDDDGDGRIDDVHGWDFVNKDGSVYDGSRVYGDGLPGIDNHGTHVSGTIGAQANNYTFNDGGTCPADATINRPLNQCGGLTGVNWNVQLISGKFLGPNGGALSDAVLAVDYMTYLKAGCKAFAAGSCPATTNVEGPHLNIVALNNSWGGGGYAQSLHDAIIRAAKVDILFIAAAGNDGLNTERRPSYPSAYSTLKGTSTQPAASYDSVIAVAAIDSAGGLASFSNWAATAVDLGAPGVGIWSTTGTPNGYTNAPYSNYSGTSMATPHVTGGAALYAANWAAKNGGGRAPAVQIRNALLDSAKNTPTASLYSKTATGGRLNIDLALTTPVRLK